MMLRLYLLQPLSIPHSYQVSRLWTKILRGLTAFVATILATDEVTESCHSGRSLFTTLIRSQDARRFRGKRLRTSRVKFDSRNP